MPTIPIFYEKEIPNSHRNIFIVKIQSLFVDLRGKLISNNFFSRKMDFRFTKIGTVGTYAKGNRENFNCTPVWSRAVHHSSRRLDARNQMIWNQNFGPIQNTVHSKLY